MTTPEDALKACRAYVAQNRSGCHVEALLEDESDYLAQLVDDDPDRVWTVGGNGPIFVSKATGKVWSNPYVYVMEKVDRMQAVEGLL